MGSPSVYRDRRAADLQRRRAVRICEADPDHGSADAAKQNVANRLVVEASHVPTALRGSLRARGPRGDPVPRASCRRCERSNARRLARMLRGHREVSVEDRAPADQQRPDESKPHVLPDVCKRNQSQPSTSVSAISPVPQSPTIVPRASLRSSDARLGSKRRVNGTATTARPARSGYHAGLDGLRALAVGGVLLYHGGVSWAGGGSSAWRPSSCSRGS